MNCAPSLLKKRLRGTIAFSMRILVLDESYPSEKNLYGDWFVHTRIKQYQTMGHEVVVADFFKPANVFQYDGVEVNQVGSIDEISKIYNTVKPDVVFIHFFHRIFLDFVKTLNAPCVIWVHGYEALAYHQRLFDFKTTKLFSELLSLKASIEQRKSMFELIHAARKKGNIGFIFPSMWMKEMTEQNNQAPISKFKVIPNPILLERFTYRQKSDTHRQRILSLRPFSSRKYANDISVRCVQILSEDKCFRDLSFNFYGKGILFEKTVRPLWKFPNVRLYPQFIENPYIPSIHREHGIFLCPTRQDAQGVSMCEAMASGLVPVTMQNTAIPEFVTHEKTGFMCKTPEEMAEVILTLQNQPYIYEAVSKAASESIQNRCSVYNIAQQELKFLSTTVDRTCAA